MKTPEPQQPYSLDRRASLAQKTTEQTNERKFCYIFMPVGFGMPSKKIEEQN